MSFPSPKFSTPSSTFFPRTAAHPKVIPLYATVIPRRAAHSLSIHRVLPERPLFHPYTTLKRKGPSPIRIASPISSDNPPSPMTPLDDEGTSTASEERSSGSTQAEVILIHPPANVELTVKTAGWDEHQQKEYRGIARAAIKKYLDATLNLNNQNKLAKEKARNHIEDAIQSFRDHADHWGADLLLRDQLKTIKDTEAARVRRMEKGKDIQGDERVFGKDGSVSMGNGRPPRKKGSS